MGQGYSVEKSWDYKGLTCTVFATSVGHRCGYVGVPKGHPLFGVDRSDETSVLGGRSIEEEFTVHGGVTFTGRWEKDFGNDIWFIGFDCGHAGDLPDPVLIWNEKIREIYATSNNGHIWITGQVADETEKLADQIAQIKHDVVVPVEVKVTKVASVSTLGRKLEI